MSLLKGLLYLPEEKKASKLCAEGFPPGGSQHRKRQLQMVCEPHLTPNSSRGQCDELALSASKSSRMPEAGEGVTEHRESGRRL